ncbi:hypothetical protein T492DRAFT_528395 [Pavlovales sp. CCMP2436]|nr:hypothetical protein T492DRAFT_528395 [Pavlovales sp. CCMP2436]
MAARCAPTRRSRRGRKRARRGRRRRGARTRRRWGGGKGQGRAQWRRRAALQDLDPIPARSGRRSLRRGRRVTLLGPYAGSPLNVAKAVLVELEVGFVPPYYMVRALEEDLDGCIKRLFVVERAVRALEASGSAFSKKAMASERMKEISKQLLDAVVLSPLGRVLVHAVALLERAVSLGLIDKLRYKLRSANFDELVGVEGKKGEGGEEGEGKAGKKGKAANVAKSKASGADGRPAPDTERIESSDDDKAAEDNSVSLEAILQQMKQQGKKSVAAGQLVETPEAAAAAKKVGKEAAQAKAKVAVASAAKAVEAEALKKAGERAAAKVTAAKEAAEVEAKEERGLAEVIALSLAEA